MATWGDRFNQTTTKKQKLPKNVRLHGGPRSMKVATRQPRPSNAKNLNNVKHT